MPKKIFIKTFGCSLNRADSSMMASLLELHGFAVVDDPSLADLTIINSCTVKGATERKIIHYADQLRKSQVPFVFAGCLGYRKDFLLKRYGSQTQVILPSQLGSIVQIVSSVLGLSSSSLPADKLSLPISFGPGIVQIPASDGCLSNCTYCATKLARPELRSYSIDRIISNIYSSLSHGAYELQLTSQDLGCYGLDRGTDLKNLLKSISSLQSSHPFKVRLGMMNPVHLKRFCKELPSLLSSPLFYSFLHVPVQSGSNRILKHMQRGNSPEEFIGMVSFLRSRIPNLTLATDIIVAYPGETQEDFQQTLDLLESVRPEVTNVSRFSPMKGTPASELEQLSAKISKERSGICSALTRNISRESLLRFIGSKQQILVTEQNRTIVGRMDNYLQVALPGLDSSYLGKSVSAKIKKILGNSLVGEVI